MWRAIVVAAMVMAGGASAMGAEDKPIEQLPQDVLELAFAWTEPIKQVAKRSRQFDPVSGLWIGLVDGSVKSVERTAQFLLEDRSSTSHEPGKIFRYSF